MLSFNLYFVDQPYTSHELPTFGEFMPHYSPQLVERWTCVSSPLLSHTRYRRRTCGSRGATQRGVRFDIGGVSQLTLWRQGRSLVRFIFTFYFVRLPLCNKYFDYIVTFISIHSVIIYVVFFGACMRCTRLCPLKPGVTLAPLPLGPSCRPHVFPMPARPPDWSNLGHGFEIQRCREPDTLSHGTFVKETLGFSRMNPLYPFLSPEPMRSCC
jgi:hypothetical protein